MGAPVELGAQASTDHAWSLAQVFGGHHSHQLPWLSAPWAPAPAGEGPEPGAPQAPQLPKNGAS